ncbi:hypothetical protein [Aeromonas sp. R9-2]|uniref:hypothetical protein n=1 Tax=Aeromonas sp. R9-2 TaxID=3138479 RepID=UPI0034A131FC
MNNENMKHLSQKVLKGRLLYGHDLREDNLLQYESCMYKNIRVRAVRSNFDSLLAEGKELPDWMKALHTNRASRGLHGPTYSKREICPRVIAMVQVIEERFGRINGRRNRKLRSDIAAHLGCTPQTVSNYLRRNGYEIAIFVFYFRYEYPEKNTRSNPKADLCEMLNILATLVETPFKKIFDKFDPVVVTFFYSFHPSAEQRISTPRSRKLQITQRKKEKDDRGRTLLDDLKSEQLELMSRMESLSRRISQAEELLLGSCSE